MNKKLLVFALLFVLILVSSFAVSTLMEEEPLSLDLKCYQKECKADKELWDDVNSKCIFTPKDYYLSDYFRENYNETELREFLSKKLDPNKKKRILDWSEEKGYPLPDKALWIEERELLFEFQCKQAGFTLESENCDKSLIDNYRHLALLDKELLKLDSSLSQKIKISEIFWDCLVPGTSEQLEKREFLTNLFKVLSIIVGLIIIVFIILLLRSKRFRKMQK